MISHDQFAKALERQRIVLSNLQINALLNDLLPNPQSGFGVGGVTVWGDEKSIEQVRRWHHDATERLPYFEKEAAPVKISRMWINQPSTLQPLYHLHGMNVLAHPDTDTVHRVYFLSGEVFSQQVPNNALSAGWVQAEKGCELRGSCLCSTRETLNCRHWRGLP